MIELITGLPDNVLGIKASGEVTGADYESVLIPAVEEMLAKRKTIRCLYLIGEEFTGFDIKAIWDDARVGIQHLTAWERVAMVTDLVWIRTMMKAFSIFIPGEIRIFNTSELNHALQWLRD